MALLITLSVITVLIASSLELNRRARVAVFSAAAAKDRHTLSTMASSGINVAMAMLVKDIMDSEIDSIQENWANPDKISAVLSSISFEDGSVTVKISDELGRIQANALVTFPDSRIFNESQRVLWDRFLRLFISSDLFESESNPNAIISSVKDWLDSGDDDAITGLNGAESGYYQDLDPGYPCKNGLFNDISELLLVKGITPEHYYGTEEAPGISEYMTVYGIKSSGDNKFTFKGRININTAELPVLISLMPEGYQDLAPLIDEYRKETSGTEYIHALSSPTWYKNVPGCSDIKIDSNIITTSSDIFRIESTAALHDMKLTITSVIRREKDKKDKRWKCKVLSMHAE
ncbi:MAG: general secretion pathway protein GspK [Deltaproteobacteria bacterium]|nr:general secretion pathway protein GspK [Deltaproteobacteria bacterium]